MPPGLQHAQSILVKSHQHWQVAPPGLVNGEKISLPPPPEGFPFPFPFPFPLDGFPLAGFFEGFFFLPRASAISVHSRVMVMTTVRRTINLMALPYEVGLRPQ